MEHNVYMMFGKISILLDDQVPSVYSLRKAFSDPDQPTGPRDHPALS